MLRIIGILTGAILAIAILIIGLGVPELAPPQDDVEITDFVVPVQEPASPALAGPAPEPEAAIAVTADEPAPAADFPAQTPDATAPEPEPDVAASTPELVMTENWYAFWSPFRSEIAANGFVSQLQETTGIDYRVVKVKTGVYEVAFAYADDADIEEKLARIATATGLDMSGG